MSSTPIKPPTPRSSSSKHDKGRYVIFTRLQKKVAASISMSNSSATSSTEQASTSSSSKKSSSSKSSPKSSKEMENVNSLYSELKSEWTKKSRNVDKISFLIDELKIALTKISYLPTNEAMAHPVEIIKLSRDMLEIAVEHSIVIKDVSSFERNMAQLKAHYYDYKTFISDSRNMYKFLGLNLLYMLSCNRVSDFHIELELLPVEVIEKNEYIGPILAIEKFIMEGRYNKIFQTEMRPTSDIYNFFMDRLLCTVRDEIGSCIEKSYCKISIQDAIKRLNLKTVEEVKNYGQKRNWNLGPDKSYYFNMNESKPKEALPSVDLADQALFYAKQLEMII